MDSPTCLLSIIMPCFNHGSYIQDALDSIKKEEINYPYEVIIVDDGSTDAGTLAKLEELKRSGYTVIHQKNGGPGAARNTAIEHASGKYILPLDSDNKITAAYINTGIPILEKGEYQIVYCTPLFFGDAEHSARQFRSKPFDIADLLEANYIDCCSLFLKEVWVKNKGFDTDIPYYGHEDWEFWINAYGNGFKFLFLKENLFYYRILANSEADKFKDDKKLYADHQYMVKKHAALFLTQYLQLSYIKRKYKTDINRFIFAPFIFLGYKLNLVKTPFIKAAERFGSGEK
jgi:glycosyltransferase involved in cell wall biosynthesis